MQVLRPHSAGRDVACGSAPVSVLLIDDEAHVRTYVRMILHSLGVEEVLEAADGRAGLDLYAEHRPALVLLDINLPVMPGEEVMRRLMELDPEALVIVLTAHNALETVRQFIELGAINYILKHQSRERVTTMLAEALATLTSGPDGVAE